MSRRPTGRGKPETLTTPQSQSSTDSVPSAKVVSAASRQARDAARRAAKVRAARVRTLKRVVAPIVAVVVVVAALVVVKVATGAGTPKSGQRPTTAAESVIADVTSVPTTTFDTVGVASSVNNLPKPISPPVPLTVDGLPRVLYVGAEYCPYCAAQRWAVVAALSRFGAFGNLSQTASSPTDVDPSTATLTFHGATYTSPLISFTGVETESNQIVNGNYAPLDTLTPADQLLLTDYDKAPYASSPGSIPFLDIAGHYISSGAAYDPGLLQGQSHEQIAGALKDPTSPIGKAIDGAANAIAAAICVATSNNPSAVCTSAGVKAGAAAIGKP